MIEQLILSLMDLSVFRVFGIELPASGVRAGRADGLRH